MLKPPNLGDRYTLQDLLGQGAVGSVYRAWDHQDGAWRAIKLLRPGLLGSRGQRERFRREARALERLQHAHIVRLYDFCDQPAQAWLAMEWVAGGSVHGWLARHGVMPARMASRILIQACDGVEHAHGLGIIHRDLKPANLLIAADGGLRIADFGLARLAESQVQLTRTNMRMGSLGFMAPEQQVNARDAGHAADIYALGATLCFLVTGKVPRRIDEALTRLHGVAPELAHVVMRATLARPEHRWPSARRMGSVLRRVLEGLPGDPSHVPDLFTAQAAREAPPHSHPTIVIDEE